MNGKNSRKKKKREKKSAYKSITFIIYNGKKLAMRTENVTNIYTPRGQLRIISLVKEDLTQVYFKSTHRLLCFHLRREGVPNR